MCNLWTKLSLGTHQRWKTHIRDTQGTARALMDFDNKMSVGPESADQLRSWVCGSGASFSTARQLQKHDLGSTKGGREILTRGRCDFGGGKKQNRNWYAP